MSKEESIEIFSDKIKLSSSLILKEMDMITHTNLIKSLSKNGLFDHDRKKDYLEWRWAWQNISELYDFLKFEYLEKLGKKEPDVKKELERIMKKYNTSSDEMEYEELLFAEDGILKMMAISKFHSVDRRSSLDGDFVDEEY